MALATVTLATYQALTQQYVNDVSASEFTTENLDNYINIARGQLAAAAQCIRYTGSFPTVASQQSYPISAITPISALSGVGVAGPLTVRQISLGIPNAGNAWLEMRPWEWAWFFWFSQPYNPSGQPRGWAVQEPGPAGAIFLNPTPASVWTMYADCVGLPNPMINQSDGEVIPYPWTDSVPYFAAYVAFVSVNRWADAQEVLMRWEGFAAWAVKTVAATVLPAYAPGGLGAIGAATKITSTGFGTPTGGSRAATGG